MVMDVSDNVFARIGRRYNYYPNTAIALAAIAYDHMNAIPGEVSSATGLQVVWGPADLAHWDRVSYSRAYVAGDASAGEYFFVIRGTDFESMSSWLQQDFDLDVAQPFANLPGNPPNVPADALISQGSFNGMCDLLKLTDPKSGQGLVDFLKALNPKYLHVTGHSLGGTLTPTMFAYLNAVLDGGGPSTRIALWSFAGLTAGGTGFNTYVNAMLAQHPDFLWRIHNSLDIAPQCWESFDGIESIYWGHDLHWDFIEKDAVRDLFADAAQPGIGYAHPQAGQSLTGVFDSGCLDANLWIGQALQQHHPSTYQQLIAAFYPLRDAAQD
jgi:Lipase (class 3)